MRIPTLLRSRVLWTVIVIGSLVGAASAEPYWYFQPFRLLLYSALDTGVSAARRYSVAVIEDQQTPEVCIAVITDRVTGQFTATSVATAACDVRR